MNSTGFLRPFMARHYNHFNAAVVEDAAKGYEAHLAAGGKMMITLAGAMLVLLPVTMFSFAIMARHSTKTLSLNFFALNLMLLLPIRSSLAAGSVALLGIVYALTVVRKALGKRSEVFVISFCCECSQP